MAPDLVVRVPRDVRDGVRAAGMDLASVMMPGDGRCHPDLRRPYHVNDNSASALHLVTDCSICVPSARPALRLPIAFSAGLHALWRSEWKQRVRAIATPPRDGRGDRLRAFARRAGSRWRRQPRAADRAFGPRGCPIIIGGCASILSHTIAAVVALLRFASLSPGASVEGIGRQLRSSRCCLVLSASYGVSVEGSVPRSGPHVVRGLYERRPRSACAAPRGRAQRLPPPLRCKRPAGESLERRG